MGLIDVSIEKRRVKLVARHGGEPVLHRFLGLLTRGRYGMIIVRETEIDGVKGTRSITMHVGEPLKTLVDQMARIERELSV